MNALWLAPALVVAIGIGVAWYLSRETARAAAELRDGMGRFSELRVALAELRDEREGLQRGLARHRRK